MLTSAGHLTYCTNIHAGESWPDHFAALKQNLPAIKAQCSPDKPMAIGLRLSNIASLDVIKPEVLKEFKEWLAENQFYVFTMNGFPYGGFHNTRVKDDVHKPDWTTKNRLDYSVRLFNILSELLPEGMDGGVSTSPLAYKYWFGTSPQEQKAARELATENILAVAEHLINIKQKTGQILHLDIEPEPDGLLDNGSEFIDWFDNCLLKIGPAYISKKLAVDDNEAEKMLKEHIRLCYDVCHFAIGFEDHDQIIERLKASGIKIGKFQISAAIQAKMDADSLKREEVIKAFTPYNESTYLHQVVAKQENGELLHYPDMPIALQDAQNPEVKEWRAHFHVPIFMEDFGVLKSTQSDIVKIIEIQKSQSLTPHLEIETYTWEVLPDALKIPLQDSIIRELLWVKEQL